MKISDLYETKTDKLKKNEKPLDDDERKKVKKANPESTIWKSVDPKSGEVTYIAHTHRASATAPTLKGILAKAKNSIDSTG